MRYKPLPSDFFIRNRESLGRQMLPGSALIIHGNGLVTSNRDAHYPFIQDSNFYYLTGIDQPDGALFLFPDHPTLEHREILFTKRNNEKTLIWEGEYLSDEQIHALSGIKRVENITDINKIVSDLLKEADNLYLNFNKDNDKDPVPFSNDYFALYYRNRYPLRSFISVQPLLQNQRRIKDPAEIEALKTAIEITHAGFNNAVKLIRPTIEEYIVESAFIGEFTARGSRGFAFDPIIASGSDTCILHYIRNDKNCKKENILLMDIGAEYAHYNADITRVFPISKKFTSRQKEIYQAVLNVMSRCVGEISTRLTLKEFNSLATTVMEEELIRLKLISSKDLNRQTKENPAYKQYFMHSISHYLGLDVHDVGDPQSKLEPGVVITLEPGIYIQKEGLGIRLENDILITKEGYINLSSDIPIEIEEVEDWMN